MMKRTSKGHYLPLCREHPSICLEFLGYRQERKIAYHQQYVIESATVSEAGKADVDAEVNTLEKIGYTELNAVGQHTIIHGRTHQSAPR